MTMKWLWRFIDRIARLLTLNDTSLAEFYGSMTLITIGAWLLLPFSTFKSVAAYRLMEGILPEPEWGCIALIFGGFQSAANLMRRQNIRRAAAFICSVFFAFMAFLALLSLPESLLVPICGTASFVEGIVFLHLRRSVDENPGAASAA